MTTNLPNLDNIYKNLLTAFDPAAKRLVQAGRELLKSWLAVTEAMKVYADALDRLGLSGTNCGGETKEIGQCLMQIADAMKELNKQERSMVGFYESHILVPTEANLDQDSKVIVDQRKTFEKKQKQMSDRLKRDKKKGVPTEETMRMLRDYQADCVKQALTEEKKRYTYMLDRHCALVTWQLQLHKTAMSLYEQSIHKWKEACANPEELSAAALAALDAAIQPYATQSSVTLSTVSCTDVKSLLNSDTDTTHDSPTKAQSVSTFHSVDNGNAKETLAGATVLLQEQQYKQMGSGAVDAPSTGSSTLSSMSRPADGDGQKRAPSMSSLVKTTNGGLEYAVWTAAGANPTDRLVLAMFTYNNGGANQLIFHEGDTIKVIQDGQHGWQFGENVTSGKRGWFPASFTKPMETTDEHQQNRSRSRYASMSTLVDAGTNGHNGNGGEQSPSSTNGGASAAELASSKHNGRPVSMMVFQSNDPATYRHAPPPPLNSHVTNYDTVPKHNPFGHVKLRRVVKTDGTPKKYG